MPGKQLPRWLPELPGFFFCGLLFLATAPAHPADGSTGGAKRPLFQVADGSTGGAKRPLFQVADGSTGGAKRPLFQVADGSTGGAKRPLFA